MRKSLFSATMVAVALSSCSKNEIIEALEPSDNINSIGMSLATGMPRGVETTTATVETSNVLNLHYCGTSSKDDSAVSGNLMMAYEEGNDAWEQTGSDILKWSSLKLPASFYSMHTGSASLNPETSTMVEASYNYEPNMTIAEQEDLVYYAGSIASMPAGGYIRGNFYHALSRVEIYSNQGSYNPYVMSVDLMNVKKGGSATLVASNGVCSWAPSEDKIGYSYLNQTILDEDVRHPVRTSNNKLITSSDDAFSPAAENNMIIMPQTLTNGLDEITSLDGDGDPVVDQSGITAEIVKSTAAYARIEGSYVKVLYRMLDADNSESTVGYFRADECKEYVSMKDAYKADPENATPVLPETINDESHLYVLVGFPFADGQEFQIGKDYDVKLGLGINGGYLLYNYYFDANGNPTNIKINGIGTGDPVIDEDSPIGIMVSVKDWVSGGDIVTE